MARRLRIALLVGSARRYRRDLLCGVAAYARTHGPWTFYHQERALEEGAPVWLENWDGDGIIAQIESRKLVEQISRMKQPTVDVYGLHHIEHVPTFDNDCQALARMAADHLLDRGFEHFAFCGLAGVHYSERSGTCFERYLVEAGYDVSIYRSPRQPRKAAASTVEAKGLLREQALARWLQSLPKPLGLMACNDLRAQQVLNACGEFGIRVPDEVAVIGADNDEVLCELSDPPLTSIDPNARQIGYEAAALLERMIHGQPPPPEKTLIKPLGVVMRQSTDSLAIGDQATAMAVHFIREHACDGIGVGEVLRHVRLSRSTLERRFAKLLGRSPKAEILRMRLQRVKQFLTETDYTLAQISRLTGSGHVENMCHLFKSKTGRTMGQYRRETRTQRPA